MKLIGHIYRSLTAALLAAVLLCVSSLVHAAPMSAAWIDEAPTVEQVFDQVKGDSELDTKARQAATFSVLRYAIQTWTGELDIRRMPPKAATIFQAYSKAAGNQPYGLHFNDGACSGSSCIRRQFYERTALYSTDPKFIGSTLSRWFDAPYVEAQVQWEKDVQSGKWQRELFPPPKPSPTTPPEDVVLGRLIGLTVVLGGGFFLYRLFRPRKPTVSETPKREVSDNFGKATYAPLQTEPDSPDVSAKGVFLGQSAEPPNPAEPIQEAGAPVFTIESRHTLVVAQPRTGKGTRVIVPTLLRYGNSMVVIDPKGENAAITARARRDELGHTVYVLNPWNYMAAEFAALGFTPTDYNPLDTLDRHDPDVVAKAQSIAEAICPTSAVGAGAVWEGNAASLLTAILLWLTDQPGETKTLARARTLVGMSRATFKANFLVNMAASTAFGGAIAELSSLFIDLAEETYSGLIFNLNKATQFLSDPQIKSHISASNFSMHELTEQPTTLYLVIPPDRIDVQRTWLKLIIGAVTQTYRDIRNKPVAKGTRRPKITRCMILIDELPALKRLSDLPRDLAMLTGYSVDFTLIVQGLDQLKAVYADESASILSNCGYKWFCNVQDLDSAKYLSETIGDKTVPTETKGQSMGMSPTGASSGSSTNYGEMGRRLLKPEEIITLGRDVAIVLPPKGQPLYLYPVDYWNLDRAFGHLSDKYPKLFTDPPLKPDPNPYFHE